MAGSSISGRVRLIFLQASLLAAAALSHAAGTPGAGKAEDLDPDASPEQAAEARYQQGLEHKAAAWAFEAEAAAAGSAQEREAALARAREAYLDAIKVQGQALKLQQQHYRAANELGYALRKTGDFRKALGAYNYALGLKPDFHEAVEYRGEAYLELGMLEKAQAAYMTLFRAAPALADQLLSAMTDWLQRNDESEFAAWVAERRALAELTSLHLRQEAGNGWADHPSE